MKVIWEKRNLSITRDAHYREHKISLRIHIHYTPTTARKCQLACTCTYHQSKCANDKKYTL